MTLASDLLNHAKQDFQDLPGAEERTALHDVFPELVTALVECAHQALLPVYDK